MVKPLCMAVFDCDGTLVDSQRGIIASVGAAFGSEGLIPPDDEMIRTGVGLHLDEAIARLAPDQDAEVQTRLVARYKDAFFTLRHSGQHEEPLYPGTKKVLRDLYDRDILLGVATGKSRRGLLATLDRHDILDLFVNLKTADDGPGKPNPAILKAAMSETGVDPQNVVMIGDTSYDMKLGVAAGVTSIGVTWGYHPITVLEQTGARYVIKEYDELPGLLDQVWGP